MHIDDLIVCDLHGQKICGQRDRTSEIAMHTTIYSLRARRERRCARSSSSGDRFRHRRTRPGQSAAAGSGHPAGGGALAAYGLPGTPALTEGMLPWIPHYDALLLENHGCTSYGSDVWQGVFSHGNGGTFRADYLCCRDAWRRPAAAAPKRLKSCLPPAPATMLTPVQQWSPACLRPLKISLKHITANCC